MTTTYNRTDDPRIPISDLSGSDELTRRLRAESGLLRGERQKEAAAQEDALRRARAERAAQATLAREDAHREAASDYNAARRVREARDAEANAARGSAHAARVRMARLTDPAYVDKSGYMPPALLRYDTAHQPKPQSSAAVARARMLSRMIRGG